MGVDLGLGIGDDLTLRGGVGWMSDSRGGGVVVGLEWEDRAWNSGAAKGWWRVAFRYCTCGIGGEFGDAHRAGDFVAVRPYLAGSFVELVGLTGRRVARLGRRRPFLYGTGASHDLFSGFHLFSHTHGWAG
jgi:hypothetical protein